MKGPLLHEPLQLPLAFFASGMAALLFQVLWFRALGRVLGNTVWSGTLVLTAFMLGMAIGGLLAARWAQRIRNPARAFALAETTVALTGSLLVWGLPVLEPLVGQWLAPIADHPTAIAVVRLALALAAMLVPTIAMGLTLALGVRILGHRETTRALGVLYAANTFGACLAPLAAEYYLIGSLGLRGTALAAACLNGVAAALALRQPAGTALPAAPAAPAPGVRGFPKRLLLAAAVTGGIALALEVIWFRLLILYAPGNDLVFALMLTVVLLGIAIGGALAPLLARVQFAWVTIGSSFAVVAGYMLAGRAFGSGKPDLMQYAVPLILPAAILSGSLFTLLGAQLRADSRNPQPAIGVLTTANTLGAALGAALAGLVLLPRLGMEWSLFLLAAGYALLPILGAKPARRVLPLAVGAAGLLFFPFGRMDTHLAAAALPYERMDGAKVVQVTQGPTTTFQLLRRDRFGEAAAWRLLTDSYSMTAIDRYAIRYMQMFAWLPFALHPDPVEHSFTTGRANAQALLSDPGLRTLTVVDVSPESSREPRCSRRARPAQGSARELALEDGRQYLRTHQESFDIITAEPPPPEMAGVVNLYTREYFMAVAERLSPGGLATYWLPVLQFEPAGAKAVTRAFCEAFPDCTLWAGGQHDWILMGGRDFGHRPGAEHFSRLWRDATAAPRLGGSGLESPLQLGAAFLADAAYLRSWYGETPALTDDHPKRIAPAPAVGRESEEYAALLKPDGARRRFEESPWVAAHWPARFIPASLPYFAIQPVLNGEITSDSDRNLANVDAILRNSSLRIRSVVARQRRQGTGDRESPPGDGWIPPGIRLCPRRSFLRGARLRQGSGTPGRGGQGRAWRYRRASFVLAVSRRPARASGGRQGRGRTGARAALLEPLTGPPGGSLAGAFRSSRPRPRWPPSVRR